MIHPIAKAIADRERCDKNSEAHEASGLKDRLVCFVHLNLLLTQHSAGAV